MPVQVFRKDANIVHRCFFSDVTSEKRLISKVYFRDSTFFPLQQFLRSFRSVINTNFHSRITISYFSTPNCQSDPEWNPRRKLKPQDILAGSLHII